MDGEGEGDILIVGQNPGGREDVAGRPFVGPSGKVLRAMLSDAGFKPEKVRFTNAVRCRTPENRPPTADEIAACRPYLAEELADRKPRAVIALGDVALRSCTGRSGVRTTRGLGLDDKNQPDGTQLRVAATYHPAYVLRVPAAKGTVVADFRRIRSALAGAAGDIQWAWYDGQLREGIQSERLAIDIETDYDPATKQGGSVIIQCAVSTPEGRTFVARGAERIGSLIGDIASLRVSCDGHNAWAFDLPRIRAQYPGARLTRGDDTMVLAYLDDETQPLGLEALCVKYLGVPGWKEGLHADPNSDEFAAYNARDAHYTSLLHSHLVKRIGNRVKIATDIIAPAWDALGACSSRGIWVSLDAVDAAEYHYTKISEAEREALGFKPTNANVATALIAEGHLLPPTATGKPCTDKSVLAALRPTPLVKRIGNWREATKALSTYMRPYRKVALAGDGRVHNEYTLWRTLTGRSSARNLNVQNLARDPLLRAFFSAPEGSRLETWDYGQIEFRLAAWIAGEENVIARYQADPNFDPHTWFAAMLYGKPESDVTKEERQIAKSANFSLLYMAQWDTLQDYARKIAGLVLDEDICREIRAIFHQTYPAFGSWYKRTSETLFANGFVESATGRRRNIGDPSLLRGPSARKFLRESVNFQVQSLAADVALLGLVAVHRRGLPINGFFHDAISFEFGPHDPEGVADALISTCMVDESLSVLRDRFEVNITIPLTVDKKVVYG